MLARSKSVKWVPASDALDGEGSPAIENKPEWTWEARFGHDVNKDDPIWSKYIEVAIAHDIDLIDSMDRGMDILLVFSGLFSAIVTTFVIQVEQDLATWDPTEYVAHLLETMFKEQLNPLLGVIAPSAPLPTIEGYTKENIREARVSVLLWYISLQLALLVAGGAVCVKMWLMEYKRSNNKYRIPYQRAIHHQRTYASFRSWYISQLGDFLGTILLLDLLPFFAGLLWHSNFWRTGNSIFWDLSSLMLGIYATFIAFITLLGFFVPGAPYQTPFSSIVRHACDRIRRHVWAVALIVLFSIPIIVLSLLPDLKPAISIAVAPLIAILWPAWIVIQTYRRQGSPIRFLHILGISMAIGINFTTTWPFKEADPATVSLPFLTFGAFCVMLWALTSLLPDRQILKNFPIVQIIGAAALIFVKQYLVWNVYPRFHGALPISVAVGVVALALVIVAFVRKTVDEDTLESEALGWLISQTDNQDTLHEALSCVPSIANNPHRRRVLSGSLPQTLTSLIGALVHTSNPTSVVQLGGLKIKQQAEGGDNGDAESRLVFYLACLAEVLQEMVESCYDAPKPKSRLGISSFLQSIGTPSALPLHQQFPFLEELESCLNIISTHKNPCLRAISSAMLYQLHPSDSSFPSSTSFRQLNNALTNQPSAFTSQAKLAEIRLFTSKYINMRKASPIAEPSTMRYLSHYCITSLDSWASGRIFDRGNLLDAMIDLTYLVVAVNFQDAISAVDRGGSIMEKLARCIDALRSRLGDASSEWTGGWDTQLLFSFLDSVIGATSGYLKLLAEKIKGDNGIIRLKEPMVVNDIQQLNNALLHLAAQDDSIGNILSVITALHAIDSISYTSLLPPHAASSVIIQLVSQSTSSKATLDRVAAIRTISHILNDITDRQQAWLAAMESSKHGLMSIPAMINSMARDEDHNCRSAALAAILNTHIFYPSSENFHDNVTDDIKASGLYVPEAAQDIRMTVLTAHGQHFRKLYIDLTQEPSPLLKGLEDYSEVKSKKGQDIVSGCIGITLLLVKSSPLEPSLQTFFGSTNLPKAIAQIISSDDPELITLQTRISAIHLFALLWKHADHAPHGQSTTLMTSSMERSALLEDIAKGVNIVVQEHESVELECAVLWVERLEMVCASPTAVNTPGLIKLVEALSKVVLWADLGKPVENSREDLLARLKILKKAIKSVSSEQSSLDTWT